MVSSLHLGCFTLLLSSVEGVRHRHRWKRDATASNSSVAGSRTTRYININSNGLSATREYQYYTPAQCTSSKCPMVLEFHGQYGSIGSSYDGQAESYGMIAVYLQGMGDGGCGTGWNTIASGQDISDSCTSPTLSGTCCYNSCSSSQCSNNNRGCRWATCHDDVAFAAGVLDEMRSALNVGDVYLTGGSNGGMFAHTLMTTMPGTFKGVVPVYGLPLIGQWELGSLGVPSALASTSVMYFHGNRDRVIPVDGGNADGWIYVSAYEAMQKLAENAGCASTRSTWTTPYDGGRKKIRCEKHDSCPAGVTISLCLYTGGHGTWESSFNDLVFWLLNQA